MVYMQRDTTKSQLLLDMLKSGASSIRQIKQASTFNAGITRRGFIVAQKAVADKPRKKKSHIVPHQNYLWQYFSTDQKKVLLNYKKHLDKS